MIDLTSTADEFALLNHLAIIVDALPGVFSSLDGMAAELAMEGFANNMEEPIEVFGQASTAWQNVASALTLMTRAQADICRRLKVSEEDWLAEQAPSVSDQRPYSERHVDLHEQLMAHGLLLRGFVRGFVGLIREMDEWVGCAVSASARLSAYLRHWHDALAAQDPNRLETLDWNRLGQRLHRINKALDPALGEWRPCADVQQALATVQHAGQLLFVAPMSAAQHAAGDLHMLAKTLEDSADQLNSLTLEQASGAYRRRLGFAVQSCDSARLHCENLLGLMGAPLSR